MLKLLTFLCTLSMYTSYVHFLCTLPMYTSYIHFLCTLSMYTSYVHFLCTLSMYTSYVHFLCTLPMYTFYVHFLNKSVHHMIYEFQQIFRILLSNDYISNCPTSTNEYLSSLKNMHYKIHVNED